MGRRFFLALFVKPLAEAASLRPCEGRASFRVTELNSTAFGAEVRVARWQPGRKIEIEWGAASDVRLRWYETSSAKLLSCTPHVEVAVLVVAWLTAWLAGADYPGSGAGLQL